MKTSNPMLQESALKSQAQTSGEVSTTRGTIVKTFALLTITVTSAAFSWTISQQSGLSGLTLIGFAGALILGFVTSFKANLAPITAPLFAICEGIVLGSLSSFFEGMYPGIAAQATLATFTVFFLMLFLYQTKIIKVTERFRSIIVSAIAGIFFVYLISFILSMFAPQFAIAGRGGIFGLLFTGAVIVIAAFSLMLDFDMIEKAETFSAPKYMEWYCAFALLVTLVWLYVEILRFLSILRSED